MSLRKLVGVLMVGAYLISLATFLDTSDPTRTIAATILYTGMAIIVAMPDREALRENRETGEE